MYRLHLKPYTETLNNGTSAELSLFKYLGKTVTPPMKYL